MEPEQTASVPPPGRFDSEGRRSSALTRLSVTFRTDFTKMTCFSSHTPKASRLRGKSGSGLLQPLTGAGATFICISAYYFGGACSSSVFRLNRPAFPPPLAP